MSNGNKDYFTEMVKLIATLGVVAIVVVGALLYLTGMLDSDGNNNDVRVQNAINDRLQPVEKVALLGDAAPAAANAAVSGADIVAKTCNACHGTGVLNAPKIGDKDAWQSRLDANGGIDGLVKSAIAGKGAMPPKGGNATLTSEQIKAAIEHMLK